MVHQALADLEDRMIQNPTVDFNQIVSNTNTEERSIL